MDSMSNTPVQDNTDNNIILFVVEGEKDEEILTHLASLCLAKGNIQPMIYRSNIYQLYNVLKKVDDDIENVDSYAVFQDIVMNREGKKLTYEREEIAEIYLFFDLDAHTNQARKLCDKGIESISEMLKIFDNEFEQGKLYISYPMVEAYKHPVNLTDMNKMLVSVSNKPKYKTFVNEICNDKLNNVSLIDQDLWNDTLSQHLRVHNHLVNNQTNLPNCYVADEFTQLIIYQNQLDKHITPNQQVRVISPFVLFLLDYLGNPLLKTWR